MTRSASTFLVAAWLAAGCGDDGTAMSESSSASTGTATSPVGSDCELDSHCRSGVCWDFSEYDSLCEGKVCSDACETDEDCVDIATMAGASQPDSARCGQDNLCDLVGTGLGSFACQ